MPYVDEINRAGETSDIYAKALSTARNINGMAFNGTSNITDFAVCATAADTAAKTATITGFSLATGSQVTIKFTNGNTAANPTLEINNSGAKSIKSAGTTTLTPDTIAAGETVQLVYDGTNWMLINGNLYPELSNVKSNIDNWSGIGDYVTDGPNKYVSSGSGSINTDSSGAPKVIKSISVVPGMTLTLKLGSVPYAGGRGAAFYNKNGTFVSGSGIKYVIDTLEYTATVPEAAEYFAFTVFTVFGESWDLIIGNKNETYKALNSLSDDISQLEVVVDNQGEETETIASNLYGIEIEGYQNKIVSTGTVTSNKVIGRNSSFEPLESALSGWEYKTADCIPGKTYALSGAAGTYFPMYWVLDSDGNALAHGDVTQGGTEFQTATVLAPDNAKTVIVNGTADHAVIMAEIMQFEKSGCGVQTAQDVWSVGTGKLKTEANLYKSSNGAFRYGNITYEGNTLKAAGDDITPVNFDGAGYVGANHGYLFAYVATKASHGLTVADIGKTYTVDGDTWVLIKVNNNTQFTVVCKDDSQWYGMKTATPPNTFDFGTPITVTSMASVGQLYPSVKNISVDVLENSNEHFIVAESYDIINPKTGIAAIIAGVGNNDNNSFATLADIVATVRNVYDFNPYGACVITQNLKITNADAKVNYYGGTQSTAFGSSDYYSVPLTTYKNFQQASGSQVDFVYTTWDDAQVPPIIYCQMNNSGANATGMMIQGILMDNRRSFIRSGNGGFISSARKMYPYAIQPRNYTEVGTYNLISFRIPMHAYDMSTDVRFAGYCKAGKDYYFFAYNNSTISDTIKVDKSLVGKKIETVIANNAVCQNALVSTGIDVQITGEGYLLLKLTD